VPEVPVSNRSNSRLNCSYLNNVLTRQQTRPTSYVAPARTTQKTRLFYYCVRVCWGHYLATATVYRVTTWQRVCMLQYFVVHLRTVSVPVLAYIEMDWRMKNDELRRIQDIPTLFGICLVTLNKTTEIFNQESMFLGRDSNRSLSGDKSAPLPLAQSVRTRMLHKNVKTNSITMNCPKKLRH
jgi:hypothetical protein